jgi:hypothetical protein
MVTRIMLAALLAALFLPSALARADNPRLVASVGQNDSFAISLRDASGNPVRHLVGLCYSRWWKRGSWSRSTGW